MIKRGLHLGWSFGIYLLALALLAACSLPALGVTPGVEHGGPTNTPSSPPTTAPSITSTYPCPLPTQELPPRVAPLTSPTGELSQVVHVLPGNYDQATVE